MKNMCDVPYGDIISLKNLYSAWDEFLVGKKPKSDVEEFSVRLIDNIVSLEEDLVNMTYTHGGYKSFFIHDPKRRHIHKASVRDRLLHHAVYRQLYPYFDRHFIYDSYSCRLGKGTHKAIDRFEAFAQKVSKNHTKTCWVLKCDIRKFFDSIDHGVLMTILSEHISEKNILLLLQNIIDSHHVERRHGAGLPLGNLTSQLFGNVYMNIFDSYVKHDLKQKYYIRYADDFVFLSQNKTELQSLIQSIRDFLRDTLRLELHPNKVVLESVSSGVDFLGWVRFPHHMLLRKKTKERMFRKLALNPKEEVFRSYLGLLSHGDTHKLAKEVRNLSWLLTDRSSAMEP
jgi:RNA-directed DNA polymerase